MQAPPLRSQKLRDVGDTARELAKLTEHPSWDALRAEFEKRKRMFHAKLANQLMAGGPKAKPFDQREIDYQRGFLSGAQAVLDTPDRAVEALEQLLRKEGNG